MRALKSTVDTKSERYRENHAAMSGLVDKLNQALAESRAGGGEKYVTRHLERGKLLPRERIELLLDRDSYFLELAPLAAHGIRGQTPGAGTIGACGQVNGK